MMYKDHFYYKTYFKDWKKEKGDYGVDNICTSEMHTFPTQSLWGGKSVSLSSLLCSFRDVVRLEILLNPGKTWLMNESKPLNKSCQAVHCCLFTAYHGVT